MNLSSTVCNPLEPFNFSTIHIMLKCITS